MPVDGVDEEFEITNGGRVKELFRIVRNYSNNIIIGEMYIDLLS